MSFRSRPFLSMCVLALSMPVSSSAQSFTSLIFNPELNDFRLLGEASTTAYSDGEVKGQHADLEMTEYLTRFGLKLHGTDSSEWFGTFEYRHFDLDTEAYFEESFLPAPDDLSDLNVGLGYRRFLDNGWLWGALVRFGSASDELFDSADEMYVKADLFLRKPANDRDGWLFMLNLNTDRDIPVLPGIAYQFVRDDWQAIIGLPVLDWRWTPSEKWTLSANYLPLHRVNLEASYNPVRFLKFSGGFEWKELYYRRADRRDDDDRIEYDEKRLWAGVDLFLSEHFGVQVNGGYAFDRSFGEGDDYGDIRDNEIEIEDGWFLGLRLGTRF